MGGSRDARVGGTSFARGLRRSLLAVAMFMCFGLIGLVLCLLPAARRHRRERAAACTVCHRRRRINRVVISAFAVLLLTGAGVRAAAAMTPLEECGGRFALGAQAALAEGHTLDPAYLRWWPATRDTVTAPTTGVMLAVTGAAGMTHCSGTSVLVAVPPPPATGIGGSIVGNIFVSWVSEVDGAWVALPGQESYVRFGTEMNADPDYVEAIARHESRHVDQWTVATLIGGPLAMPVAYYVDSLFFPLARNHFERNAGLGDGGYEDPPDFGPAPLWWPLAITVALVLLLLGRHIRRASRALVAGRAGLRAHEEGRCPVHSRGWFREGPHPLPQSG